MQSYFKFNYFHLNFPTKNRTNSIHLPLVYYVGFFQILDINHIIHIYFLMS